LEKEKKQKRKGLKRFLTGASLTIDLSSPKHRRNLFFGFIGLIVFGLVLLAGGLKGYEYTESAEFCGSLCHPMTSEFVRYEKSPHSNIDCAKCHIGPGTSFFVRSKIDGIRQVYAVLADTYERPIKGPVHSLRPARDTCEECHRPTGFKDNIIKTKQHYDNDEANTPVMSTLILKMGGWREKTGVSEGIHWHITNPVYYIAADDRNQVIAWIGVEQEDGTLKEFFARDMLNMDRESFVESAKDEGRVREMDCIDCHNRAAHYIPAPTEVVDDAIKEGLISRDLPYVRKKAVEILTPSYQSVQDGHDAIESLRDFYKMEYPAVYNSKSSEIDKAVETLIEIFDETNFPDMNLNWETNPANDRHRPSLGCFRCHDGKHVTIDDTGNELETVSVKCNLCHTVPIVGRGDDRLVEAPVVVGDVPETHADFRWTIEHRETTVEQTAECYQCHGQGFCNNGVCHNLDHPKDMLFTHADEYLEQGDQVCYTCHQDILCSRCHPGGIIKNP